MNSRPIPLLAPRTAMRMVHLYPTSTATGPIAIVCRRFLATVSPRQSRDPPCTPSGKTSLSCQFEYLLPTGSSKPHARTLARIPSRSFVMMSSHLPSHDDDGMLDAFAMDRRGFAFVAELLEQRGLALFRVLNVALLDVAVAADRFGYRGQLHRRFVVAGIEVGDQLLNQPLVFHD